MKDMTGLRFERLVVIERIGTQNGQALWKCRCDCGNECNVIGQNLRRLKQKSCGCYNVSRITKHGSSTRQNRTSEYRSWKAMKSRCYRINDIEYESYGGRGIIVCDRWKDSFLNFLEDMGNKPTTKHTIDRIDSSGNYEPSNCRWANGTEQIRNQRIRKDNKSGQKGVYWDKKYQKWSVSIGGVEEKGKNKFLGYFDELSDAIEARKEAELRYWGTR